MNGKLRRVFQLIKFLRYSVTMDFLVSQNQQVRYASVTAATVLEKKAVARDRNVIGDGMVRSYYQVMVVSINIYPCLFQVTHCKKCKFQLLLPV